MNIKHATEVLGKRPSKKVWNHIPTLRYWYVYRKSMCQDKELLLQTVSGEHRFHMVQEHNLLEGLLKIMEVTTDPLTKKMISNLVEQSEINQLLHIRELFPNPQGFGGTQQQKI